MAKIKFNLNFGGEQIRTLDDLRDNFSIEDILDVYNNGLLVKWLDVRNHKDELARVKAIQATDAHGVLSELIQIFGVTSDESEIQESLSILDYLDERKRFWADIKAGKFDEVSQQQGKEKILLNYHEGYNALVKDIVSHPDDLHYIYDRLDEIAGEHQELLRLNSSNLFYYFVDKAPLAAFALFGDSATRPYYALNDEELKKCNTHSNNDYSEYSDYDWEIRTRSGWDKLNLRPLLHLMNKINMTNTLLKIRREVHVLMRDYNDHSLEKEIFQDYLIHSKISGGWQQIQPQGKKYMIIRAQLV